MNMAGPLRVVHYLNQFFAGIGGEDTANLPPRVQEGPVGSGRALQQVLKDAGTVVATLICGDNYINDMRDQALAVILERLQAFKPDVLIAGPAFESGRYGLACAEVCKAAQGAGIPSLTGMHADNPGVESGRPDVLIVPTGASPVEMQAALTAMARLGGKLGRKETLGTAEIEGFLPRGIRQVYTRQAPGYRRALDMLAAKLQGQSFMTEVPILVPQRVPPAPPIHDLSTTTIALVTTGGLVRKGNPDKQVSANATRYFRHNVAELESLHGKDWEAYHAGYFNHIVNRNPNYILPLNFMRDLEHKGEIGGVYPWIYALPGVSTPVAQAKRMGAEIARELVESRVGGCLLVAT
jgi:glycine reductase complex component B subunit gamma